MATDSDSRTPAFPVPVADVVATLIELFNHQGKTDVAALLAESEAHIEQLEYDNWNGGTSTWGLCLDVPVPRFASIEARLTEVEDDIRAKLQHLSRPYPNDHLVVQSIAPLTRSDALARQVVPPEHDVLRIWPKGFFRLFLSHLAKHKVAVSALKEELEDLGVSGFVAHDAIEGGREWRKEIELGLKSMNALAALITPDFHAS